MKPGDVLPDGSILVGSDVVCERGQVFVDREQAARAKTFGWRKVYANKNGLVLVERGTRQLDMKAYEARCYRAYKEKKCNGS